MKEQVSVICADAELGGPKSGHRLCSQITPDWLRQESHMLLVRDLGTPVNLSRISPKRLRYADRRVCESHSLKASTALPTSITRMCITDKGERGEVFTRRKEMSP